MTKLLIVNADDFGLNQAANLGIVDCHRAGAVTSTTLMANGSAFDEAVELARQSPSLAVGLHFNLTWGRPVSPAAEVRSLTDADGVFLSRGALARRALLGQLRPAEIESELKAQLRKTTDGGIDLTHVDSHQHVHAFKPIFAAVAGLCESMRLPVRVPWVSEGSSSGAARRVRRTLLSATLRHAVRPWQGRVQWNDGISSIFDWTGDPDVPDAMRYESLLRAAPHGVHELMVHPVTSAAAMSGFTTIGDIGEQEYRFLMSGELQSLSSRLGYRLGSYRDLAY